MLLDENKIEISEKDDRIYQLQSIGMPGMELVIENDGAYIVSDSIYIPIPEQNLEGITTTIKGETGVTCHRLGNQMVITDEQYKILKAILDEKPTIEE